MKEKNREETENLLLGTVDNLVRTRGFSALGINAVAREAGVSKVLIYRYFKDFPGLLETWVLKNNYWSGSDFEPQTGKGTVQEVILGVFAGQIDDLRKNPVRREVLKWLLTDDSESARITRARIEEHGLSLTRKFAGLGSVNEKYDAEALVALITAGTAYLSLMSDRADVYNGVPLNNEEGWNRIKNVLGVLVSDLVKE